MRELERDKNGNHRVLPALAVVGAGRVGRAVAAAARDAGIEHVLAGRSGALTASREAEAALLCVPDREIQAACATVAGAVPPLRLVGHTSGAGALDLLAPAAAAGASTFSIHPLQTIRGEASDLAAAPCAVSASDPGALTFAERLSSALGMAPFRVPDDRRAAYHAAASIASNFLVALEESAVALLHSAGVEDGRRLLGPLVLRSAANWSEQGAAALTGPITRGDEETVDRHLAAIAASDPALLDLYRALAERTREVATAGEAGARATEEIA